MDHENKIIFFAEIIQYLSREIKISGTCHFLGFSGTTKQDREMNSD
jgi:hypothetical protein